MEGKGEGEKEGEERHREKERVKEGGREGRKRERGSSYLFKREMEKERAGWRRGRRSACLSGRWGAGSERGLSLKGTGTQVTDQASGLQ